MNNIKSSIGRKIIVLNFLSLDGVMQAPGGPKEDTSGGFKYGGWTFPFFDDDSAKFMDEQMKGKYDLLLGRKTFEIFESYWPKHSDEWPQINKITKYVVSKHLKKTNWENTVVLNNIEEIKKVKNEKGIDLQIYGSSKLIQSLLKNDLVDEMWLKIFPITLGKGKKLFNEGTIPAKFNLLDLKSTKSGVIFASYKRSGDIKTGSFA